MLDNLLKAKHWHLFLIFFGLPMILLIIFQAIMINDLENFYETDYSNEVIFDSFSNFFYVIMVISLVVGIIQLLWQKQIGNRLQAYIPKDLRLNTNFFNFVIYFQLFTLIILIISFLYLLTELFKFANDSSTAALEDIEWGPFLFFEDITDAILVLLPIFFGILLLNLIFAVYSYYFCAKTLKTAEMQQQVKFSDYIGYIIAFWYSVIGVWIIQPEVHKILNREDKQLTS